MPSTHVRAEWIRALGFVLAAFAMAVMALVDARDQTLVWVAGLAVAIVALAALLSAVLTIESGRELYAALGRLRPAAALRALVDLNRIPAAPAPNRIPRLIVVVFGPLSGAAALIMVVRLATL